MLSNSTKVNQPSAGSTAASTTATNQYRGYSPSKPKWKAANLGLQQTTPVNQVTGGLNQGGMMTHV